MATPNVRVLFDDGRTEEVRLNPRVLVEVERKFGNAIPPLEGTYYGAWLRLGRPGTFDEWLDTVESIEQVDGDAVVPTEPGASAGS